MVELIAEAEYTKQRQLIENQAEIMKIQEIAYSRARAEIYSNHGAKSINVRSRLSYIIDLALKCHPRKRAQSSLHQCL